MITFADVKYKIVGFDSETGRLSVIYDGIPTVSIIELHLTPQGLYPEGKQLDEFIRMMCPIHIINRNLTIKKGVANSDNIASLVEDMPPEIALPPSKSLPF